MGGQPIRHNLTSYWEPDAALSDEAVASWLHNAERIATGLTILAHLDAFIDAEHFRVGFSCDGDLELAKAYEVAILRENIEGRRVAPIVANRSLPADEIVLPCKPFATDELITQSVLAAMKASHAIEFETIWDAEIAAGG